MSEFTRLDFGHLPGGAAAACERLPELPGLYAFFAPTPTLPTYDRETFLDSLRSLVEQRASPKLTTRAGSLHSITLDNFSSLSAHKSEVLLELAGNDEFREEISKLIGLCMPLRAPLYVGQTQSIKTRVKQHLKPGSTLSQRLRECDIQLDKCVFGYRITPDLELLKTSESLQLAEEIITRVLRPGYVARIG